MRQRQSSSWFAVWLLLLAAGCGPAQFTATYAPMTIRAAVKAKPVPMSRLSEIAQRILFETGEATLLAESHAVLDEVATILEANTQVQSIEIQGHTDSVGRQQKNVELSQRRADTVRQYLVGKGIAAERLVAKGYGPSRPIAGNDTDEGRAKNRRVEFVILEQQTQPGS